MQPTDSCRGILAIPIAIATVLAGCGDADDSQAVVPSPETTVEFTLPLATLRVPQRMVSIDFARFEDSIADELGRRVGGDQGRQLVQQVRAIAAQGLLDFCAFDPSTPQDGFAENINVIVSPIPAGVDRAAILAANLDQLRQVGVTVVGTDVLDCGDRTFDRVRTRLERTRSEGQVYLLSRDGSLHTVTFAANPESADAFLGASDSIMREYRPR